MGYSREQLEPVIAATARAVNHTPDLLTQSLALSSLARHRDVREFPPVSDALQYAATTLRQVCFQLTGVSDVLWQSIEKRADEPFDYPVLAGRRRHSQVEWVRFARFASGEILERSPLLSTATALQELSAQLRALPDLYRTVVPLLNQDKELAGGTPGTLAARVREALGAVLDARRRVPGTRRPGPRERHGVTAAAAGAPNVDDAARAIGVIAQVMTRRVARVGTPEAAKQLALLLRDGPTIAWGSTVYWDAVSRACDGAKPWQASGPTPVTSDDQVAAGMDLLDSMWDAWNRSATRAGNSYLGKEMTQFVAVMQRTYPRVRTAIDQLVRHTSAPPPVAESVSSEPVSAPKSTQLEEGAELDEELAALLREAQSNLDDDF